MRRAKGKARPVEKRSTATGLVVPLLTWRCCWSMLERERERREKERVCGFRFVLLKRG